MAARYDGPRCGRELRAYVLNRARPSDYGGEVPVCGLREDHREPCVSEEALMHGRIRRNARRRKS